MSFDPATATLDDPETAQSPAAFDPASAQLEGFDPASAQLEDTGPTIGQRLASVATAAADLLAPAARADVAAAQAKTAAGQMDKVVPAVDVLVPAAARTVLPVAAMAGSLATTPATGPVGVLATGAAAAFGASVGDALAQAYEVARGKRAQTSTAENVKGAIATGVTMGAPGLKAAPEMVFRPIANIVRHAVLGGSTFSGAESIAQLATGENNPDKVRDSAAWGAVLGALGGWLQNTQLKEAQLEAAMNLGRRFGFKGSTLAEARAWWEGEMRVERARRVSPVQPAEEGAIVPAGQPPVPPPGYETPGSFPLPLPAPRPPAEAPPVPAPAAPAGGGGPLAASTGPVSSPPMPGQPGIEGAPPTVEPPAPAVQLVYDFQGRALEQPADQPTPPNMVNAEQWADLAPLLAAGKLDAFKSAWQKAVKANAKLARDVAANAGAREAQTAAKGRRLAFAPRPDGVVDAIDAVQEMGRIPAPPLEGRGGEYDEFEEFFGRTGGLHFLVNAGRRGGFDTWLDDLRAQFPFVKATNLVELHSELQAARASRQQLKERMGKERYVAGVEQAFLENVRRHGGRAPRGVVIDDIGKAGVFEIGKEDFEVKGTRYDEETDILYYIVQDGHRMEVPSGTMVYPDKGQFTQAAAPTEPAPGAPQSDDPFADNYVPDAPPPSPVGVSEPDAKAVAGVAPAGSPVDPGPAVPPPAAATPSTPPVAAVGTAAVPRQDQGGRAGASPARETALPIVDQGGQTGMFSESEVQFNLAGEQAQDFTGTVDQQTAAREAKARQEADQGKLFGGGTGGVGRPMPAAGMPPIPPGVPQARINHGFMPVALERVAPGSGTIDVLTVHDRMLAVIRAAGGESAIREGRFYQTALGIAKQFEETIRVRLLTDLPTVAHEVAHVVSKNVFGSMKSRALLAALPARPIVKELQALGKALYGTRRPTAGYTAEGFSEFVRLWLTTESAATKAPETNRWFEGAWFQSHPEIAEAMLNARAAMDLWRGQGAAARLDAQHKASPGRFERWRAGLKEAFSRRAVVEESAPLEELARAAEKLLGAKLMPASNPALVFQSVRQLAGAVLETMVDRGMVDVYGNITGPSLREVASIIRPDEAADFSRYLLALEAIERLKQGKQPGIAAEDAVYIRDKYGANPRFVRAAQGWSAWYRGVLEYLRGAWPEQNGRLVDAILAKNPAYYGPLARVLDPSKVRPAAEAGTGGGLHRFKGSGLPIKEIIQQGLMVAESIIARAHRDMVMRSAVNLSAIEGLGFLVEEVPRTRVVERVNIEKVRDQLEAMGVDTSAIPPDEMLAYGSHLDTPTGVDPIIPIERNGTVRWYQVSREVFEVLEGVQAPARLGPAFELFFGGPARMFKLGTTGLRASFSLFTNPARDLPTFLLQSVYGNPASRVAAYFNAMGQIVLAGLTGHQTDAVKLYHRLGLQASTWLGGDIQQVQREARGLFRGKFFRRLTTPLETMREALSFTEAGPRLAEFMLAMREAGIDPGTAALTADQVIMLRLAWRRVTTDFAAHGSKWEAVRRAVPFSGATVQGTRAFARAMISDQGPRDKSNALLKFILSGATLLTVPALLNWWRHKDKDWYRALPWRERYLYWNIEVGNQVIQIPTPPEWGGWFKIMPEALMDAWYQRDPRAVTEAMSFIIAQQNPLDYPPLVKAVVEDARNRVEFFDRPIVPRGELDLQPGSQRGRYTSALGKALGDAFPEKVSPRRFDAAVRAVLGGLGGDVIDAPEAIMRALGLGVREREKEPSDIPVFGRAFRRGGRISANNRYLFEYWDDLARYRSIVASDRHAIGETVKDMAAGGAVRQVPLKLTAEEAERNYARFLAAREPTIRAYLDVAERLPKVAARQRLYTLAAEEARAVLTFRPKK